MIGVAGGLEQWFSVKYSKLCTKISNILSTNGGILKGY